MTNLPCTWASRGAALAVLTLLAACSTRPAEPEPPPRVSLAGQQPAAASVRAQLHTELASGYYERGQMEIALTELNEALALDPNYAPTYNIYGLVYATLGEDAKAQQAFMRAVELAPGDSEIHQNWGWYLCSHGRERDSLTQFELAVRNPLYRTPEIALVNAGRCALSIGEKSAAEAYFKRTLEVQPGNAMASYGLAQIAYGDKHYEEARTWMKAVVLTNNPPADGLYLGMCVERKLGDRQAELSYMSQLKNRYPDAPETKAAEAGQCQ